MRYINPNSKAALIATAVLVFLAAGTLFAWLTTTSGNDNTPSTPTPSPTVSVSPNATSNPSPSSSPSVSVTPTTHQLKVYFSKHPESDDDPSKVFAVSRSTTSQGVAHFVLDEYLKGPTVNEAAAGYYKVLNVSGESSCSGENFSIDITNKVATVRFCRDTSMAGDLDVGRGKTAFESMLLQFPTINKVVVLNKNGGCLFDLSGMDLCKQ